jgi:hypothetical protein
VRSTATGNCSFSNTKKTSEEELGDEWQSIAKIIIFTAIFIRHDIITVIRKIASSMTGFLSVSAQKCADNYPFQQQFWLFMYKIIVICLSFCYAIK